MRKQSFLTSIVLLFFLALDCYAQGESALQFLLISPYAEANGMGEASVALLSDDPIALMSNPARLGIRGEGGRSALSFGYNHADWLPRLSQKDLWLRSFAVNAGVNLKREFGLSPDLTIGLAYSRMYLNLGRFSVTGPGGPDPVSTFDAHESSDQYSLGFGLDYWVRLSAGGTYKHVASDLGAIAPSGGTPARATVNMHDYGFLLQVPVVGVISRLQDSPIRLLPSVFPFFDLSFGVARSNLGNATVKYYDLDQPDPLPRYARVGIGVDLGLDYVQSGAELRPLRIRWTREANDLLVRRSASLLDSTGSPVGAGSWEYQGGMGDIDIFGEVIGGKTNSQTIRKTGWDIELFEIISVRGGRFEEDPYHGNRRFNTSGFGVRLRGVAKLLRAADASAAADGIVGFILDHVDLRYNQSSLNTDDPRSPLATTEFKAINLFITN